MRPTWTNQVNEAHKLNSFELRRHASVCEQNQCRCQTALDDMELDERGFTCAASYVLKARRHAWEYLNCVFKAPPVTTVRWDLDSWVNFVDWTNEHNNKQARKAIAILDAMDGN